MSKITSRAARKAAKTTAKHGVRGTVSKVRRDPARTGWLVGFGAAIGGLVAGCAAWFTARSKYAAS